MKNIPFANLVIGTFFSFEGNVYRRITDSAAGAGRAQYVRCKNAPELEGTETFFAKSMLINF